MKTTPFEMVFIIREEKWMQIPALVQETRLQLQ